MTTHARVYDGGAVALTRRYPSSSQPGTSWTAQAVISEYGVGTVCDCFGYVSHGHCWHTQTLLEEANVMQASETVETGTVAPPGGTREALVPYTELRPPAALLPTLNELNVLAKLANHLGNAGAQKAIPACWKNPGSVFLGMLSGWELGLRPMQSLRLLFVVNGRVDMYAQLMMGLVLKRDASAEFRWTVFPDVEAGAEVQLWRRGKMVSIGRWTPEDARRARQIKPENKDSDPWVAYPLDMYAWAACKRACRMGGPDLINAIEGIGELGGMVDSNALLAEAAETPVDNFDLPEASLDFAGGRDEEEGPAPAQLPAATGQKWEYDWWPHLLKARSQHGFTNADVEAVIGNPPEDIVSHVTDQFVKENGIGKLISRAVEEKAKRETAAEPVPLRRPEPAAPLQQRALDEPDDLPFN